MVAFALLVKCLLGSSGVTGAKLTVRSVRVLLLVWSAGAGAASLCPVPADLGVVDIVLITSLTAAGVPAPHAVAAVLVYRIISFKILTTLVVYVLRLTPRRRSGYSARRAKAVRVPAAQLAGPSAPATAMTRPASASMTNSHGWYTDSSEAGTSEFDACAMTGTTP